MSEPTYLKCPCQKCGGSIEFPAQGLGMGVNCPHCSQRTTLFAPEAVVEENPPAAPPSEAISGHPVQTSGPGLEASAPIRARSGLAFAIVALGVLAAGAGVWFHFKMQRAAGSDQISSSSTKAISTNTLLAPTANNAEASVPRPTPTKPKLLEDLKVGAITLEKAKSGSLLYAVGVLKNESDHARYDVRIELDVSDATGSRTSKATDYMQVIDPRKSWRFRALILDARAASAKLAKVSEEP